jgi:hypothetical protein
VASLVRFLPAVALRALAPTPVRDAPHSPDGGAVTDYEGEVSPAAARRSSSVVRRISASVAARRSHHRGTARPFTCAARRAAVSPARALEFLPGVGHPGLAESFVAAFLSVLT